MEPSVARNIAHHRHIGQRTRFGESVTEHVERVAAAVPVEAQVTAWLHDILERSQTSVTELSDQGLTLVELEALELLTHRKGVPYEQYVLRIAFAKGPAGRLARIVKLADLDDHLAHESVVGAPPYGWARRQIAIGAARDDHAAHSSRAV